ncbi:MAG: YceI family protein [Pseudomonadota bacterium]
MLKLALALAAGLAVVSPAVAESVKPAALDVPAGTYAIDPTHASVTWKVGHLGLSNYTARFVKFDAKLDFDPAAMDKSKLTVTIDPKSIRTDYPFADTKDFDKKLAEDAEYFNANAHPEITFTSTAVEMTGEKTAKVTGDMTMLGVTKPVTLDVTLNGAMKEQPFAKKPALGFSASTVIKRSEFGFTKLVPVVSDDVTLLIEAEFLGQ